MQVQQTRPLWSGMGETLSTQDLCGRLKGLKIRKPTPHMGRKRKSFNKDPLCGREKYKESVGSRYLAAKTQLQKETAAKRTVR